MKATRLGRPLGGAQELMIDRIPPRLERVLMTVQGMRKIKIQPWPPENPARVIRGAAARRIRRALDQRKP